MERKDLNQSTKEENKNNELHYIEKEIEKISNTLTELDRKNGTHAFMSIEYQGLEGGLTYLKKRREEIFKGVNKCFEMKGVRGCPPQKKK